MKDRFDIRRSYFLLGAIVLLLLVAQFFTGNGKGVSISVIPAILLLAANAFLLSRAVNYFSIGFNISAPLLFTALALSYPGFLCFNTEPVAALLMNISLFLAMKFFCGEISNDRMFFSTLFAGAASFFFPPFLWMLPALLLLCFAPAGDKGRYVAMTISGFLVPLLFYVGFTFITKGYGAVVNCTGEYFASCLAPNFGFASTSAARAIKVLVLAVIFVVAATDYVRNSSAYSVTHSRSVFLMLVYSVIMALLLALFSSGNLLLNITVLVFPVSIVIFDYLVTSGKGRTGRIALCFVVLALALEFLAKPLSL